MIFPPGIHYNFQKLLITNENCCEEFANLLSENDNTQSSLFIFLFWPELAKFSLLKMNVFG